MIGTFFGIRVVVNVENFAMSDNSIKTTPSVGPSSYGYLDVDLELLRRRWLAMLLIGTPGSAIIEKDVTTTVRSRTSISIALKESSARVRGAGFRRSVNERRSEPSQYEFSKLALETYIRFLLSSSSIKHQSGSAKYWSTLCFQKRHQKARRF